MKRKLFCEINPFCYEISVRKERIKRHIKNILTNKRFATKKSEVILNNIIKSHTSILKRRLVGVDQRLQENKVTNIFIACNKINKIIIEPGEIFSFWKILGKTTKDQGYVNGLVISKDGFKEGIGGGLCQMANMIHYLVLNSPLEVIEIHHHSDALFPDDRRKVPFGTGVSVCYNNIDYQFKNTLKQPVQILVWIENDELCGELRSDQEINYRYRLTEENHHFRKENDKYYRISQVYKITIDKKTNEEIKKELILDNHSLVMYDYSLIPTNEIRND